MLATVMPEDMIKMLKVEHVVSLVLFLCHESNEESGVTYECGGGTYQKVQLARSPGYVHDLSKGDPSIEDVAKNWAAVNDMKGHELVDSGSQAGIQNVMRSKL